ncbi:MAG: T9SS type A sorting domain-containing protein [candidate division Zixibacteria bacterium]|nr:T9SS type A sorting domain-containing protein [candidate division Zixibacteria bacterium]
MHKYGIALIAVFAVLFAVSTASADLVINEIMYNPPFYGGDPDSTMDDNYFEYVEIHNTDASPVVLDGYYLRNLYYGVDDTLYQFTGGATIAANGYVVVARCADSMTSSSHYNLSSSIVFGDPGGNWYQQQLGNSGGIVVLFDNADVVVDSVEYDDNTPWPSLSDGDGPSAELLNPAFDNNVGENWWHSYDDNLLSPGTPGAVNSTPELVINEIMYNPDHGNDDYYEYLEIYNIEPTMVNLNNVVVSNAIDYTFGAGTYIVSGGYTVLCQNVDSVTTFYAIDTSLVYEFSGQLNNSGESIVITSANGFEIDSVYYWDGDYDWPVEPDGNGPSAELLSPDLDNNLGTNWAASVTPDSLGTPKAQNSVYSSGNQPPTIANLMNTPATPGVGQSALISATITDLALTASVVSADLYYDNGSGYTSMAMSNVADSFYATIPGQTEGTTVNYYVSAMDNEGDSTISDTLSYYTTDATFDIVINEIMYNFWDDYLPDNEDTLFEYIELYNNSNDSVDLSDWYFREGIEFTFPTDAYILPNDFVLVAVLPDTVVDYYGLDADRVYGPFENSTALSNGGEDLVLATFYGAAVDSVEYDDESPWPSTPDGDGPSLECIDFALDNNVASNWAASVAPDSFGTPLATNSNYIGNVLDVELTILTPYVQSNGGYLGFSATVTNATGATVPNVYGEIHPTIGDCVSGTQFDFNMYKVMTTNLADGESFTGYYYMTMGNYSNLPNQVALAIEVGTAPNTYQSEDCGEFIFLHEWARNGAPSWTDMEWFEREDMNLPTVTALGQNYPNPFNATSAIPFELAENGNVSLKVYNLAGQLVETLLDGQMQAGSHVINWDASSVASGVYFYKLEAGNYSSTRKMNLLK